MSTFDTVHRFRTLSNRNFVTPLACAECGGELTIKLGEDDEPATKCYRCGASANVSMATILMMERVIRAYESKRA